MTKYWALIAFQLICLAESVKGVQCPPETNITKSGVGKKEKCELGSTKFREHHEYVCCDTSEWCQHRMHSGCNYEKSSESFEFEHCNTDNKNIERWFCPVIIADLVRNPLAIIHKGIKECETFVDCPHDSFCSAAYNEAYEGRDRSGPGGTALKYCFQWFDYIDYFYPQPKICDKDDECFEGTCDTYLDSKIFDKTGMSHKGLCRRRDPYEWAWEVVETCSAGRSMAPGVACNTTSQCYNNTDYDLNDRLYKWCDIGIGKCCQENDKKLDEIITCPDGQTPLYAQPKCNASQSGDDDDDATCENSGGRCYRQRCCPQTELKNGKFQLSATHSFMTNVECDVRTALAHRFEFSYCKDDRIWTMSEGMVEMKKEGCSTNSDCGKEEICANLEYSKPRKCFVSPRSTNLVGSLEQAFKVILDIVKKMGF